MTIHSAVVDKEQKKTKDPKFTANYYTQSTLTNKKLLKLRYTSPVTPNPNNQIGD